MRNKIASFIPLTAILMCCLFTGCTLDGPHEDPSLVDRSVGWEPSVMYRDAFDSLKDTNSPFYRSFLFAGSEISKGHPQYVNMEDEASVILETALKAAFHDRYIDRGSTKVQTLSRESCHVAVYLGGETAAFIDTKNGRIVQCTDIKIQTHVSIDSNGMAHIAVDLAKLTDDEAKELSTYIRGFSDENMPTPFADPRDCPLDVTKAFEVSSKNLYKLYSSGRWKYIGDGPYTVYNIEVSNSWLIIGKYFTLLLDKNTGEKKFFSVVKEGFEDLSKAL